MGAQQKTSLGQAGEGPPKMAPFSRTYSEQFFSGLNDENEGRNVAARATVSPREGSFSLSFFLVRGKKHATNILKKLRHDSQQRGSRRMRGSDRVNFLSFFKTERGRVPFRATPEIRRSRERQFARPRERACPAAFFFARRPRVRLRPSVAPRIVCHQKLLRSRCRGRPLAALWREREKQLSSPREKKLRSAERESDAIRRRSRISISRARDSTGRVAPARLESPGPVLHRRALHYVRRAQWLGLVRAGRLLFQKSPASLMERTFFEREC